MRTMNCLSLGGMRGTLKATLQLRVRCGAARRNFSTEEGKSAAPCHPTMQNRQNLRSAKPPVKGTTAPPTSQHISPLLLWSSSSLLLPAQALAAEDGASGGFNVMALGKLGLILLVADVITGIVLGKNVLKMFGGDKRGEGSPDWKEKAADELMKKIKEKEGGADKPDDGPDKP